MPSTGDPDVSWRDVFVHPAEPGLERPPAIDEGWIVEVDVEYRQSCGENRFIRCQRCSTSIEQCRTHVRVVVLEADDVRRFAAHKTVHFCDRRCWGEWANSNWR